MKLEMKTITRLAVLLAVVMFAGCTVEDSQTGSVQKKQSGNVLVERIVDGDTIIIQGGERVRYIGVDTPETKHPSKPVQYCGKEATALNTRLVSGKSVRLEMDAQERDKYGRLLAYIYVQGEAGTELFVNLELVRQGLAVVSTYPPNVAHVEAFEAAQKEARQAGRGVWGDGECKPVDGVSGSSGLRSDVREPATSPDRSGCTYVGSVNSDKFHEPGCRHAKSIKPKNIRCFKSRGEAIAAGYVPCKVCRP